MGPAPFRADAIFSQRTSSIWIRGSGARHLRLLTINIKLEGIMEYEGIADFVWDIE